MDIIDLFLIWLITSLQSETTIKRSMFSKIIKNRSVILTTPIFYINASPHIGHLYTMFISDYIKRVLILNENEVVLTSGTDEHGEKVRRAAEIKGVGIREHVDVSSKVFRELARKFDVDLDGFIRTTEEDHMNTVNDVWEIMQGKGYIQKEVYRGWYSIREETFFHERDLRKDENGNLVTEEGDPVERVEEENYVLKSLGFVKEPAEFIERSKVYPSKQKSRLIGLVGFRDVSISRPVSRVRWGVSLRSDPSCVVYVWFDALINYLTLSKRFKLMEEDYSLNKDTVMINVVGKDIIKFHAVMFPIINNMLGLDFDHRIICHEHWLKDGRKMSKSYGNIVDPDSLITSSQSVEELKLYFIVYGPYNSDSDYSEKQMVGLYNNFVDKIVNCYSRVFSPGFLKNTDFSSLDTRTLLEDTGFVKDVEANLENVLGYVDFEKNPEEAWNSLLKYYDYLNNSITLQTPWKIKDKEQKTAVISRFIAALIYPLPLLYLFVPRLSVSLGKQISMNHLKHHGGLQEVYEAMRKGDSSLESRINNMMTNIDQIRRSKLETVKDGAEKEKEDDGVLMK